MLEGLLLALGYSVEITIDNNDLLIGMGSKSEGHAQGKRKMCLQFLYQFTSIQYDENGGAFVLVAEPNDDGSAVAVKKNIEVGEEVDYYTEVTGGELKEGDMLIYDTAPFSVTEGQSFAPEQMYPNQDMGLDGGAGTSSAPATMSVGGVQ